MRNRPAPLICLSEHEPPHGRRTVDAVANAIGKTAKRICISAQSLRISARVRTQNTRFTCSIRSHTTGRLFGTNLLRKLGQPARHSDHRSALFFVGVSPAHPTATRLPTNDVVSRQNYAVRRANDRGKSTPSKMVQPLQPRRNDPRGAMICRNSDTPRSSVRKNSARTGATTPIDVGPRETNSSVQIVARAVVRTRS